MTSRIAFTQVVWFELHIESADEAYISIPHWGLIRVWYPEAA